MIRRSLKNLLEDKILKIFKILFLLPVLLFVHTSSLFSQEIVEGQLFEYLEWSIENETYEGNPFDLVADVVFIHNTTQKVKTSQMFYDGNNIWKFRFTGTRIGEWQYYTISEDSQLDSLNGIIRINENSDKSRYGFLTNIGNKYVIQTSDTTVKGFLFNVYMNLNNHNYSFRNGTAEDFIQYADEAIANGATVLFSDVIANSWFNFPTLAYSEGVSNNPDLKTFERLELLISTARAKGIIVHLWAWGDEERKQTAMGIGGGINQGVDKRLQRYICARLGALPGWSMGYGFDLHEWVTKQEVQEWAKFLNSHLGWPHLLSARGINLDENNFINSYDGAGRETAELHTTEYGPVNFEEVWVDMNSDIDSPHLYEERHTYLRPNFNLDMEGTRRLMWWQAVSGGMGGWYGFYDCINHPNLGPCLDPNYNNIYPQPDQLVTHNTFWLKKNRFLINSQTNNNLSNGYTLSTKDSENIIIYKEDTDSIIFNSEIDLSDQSIVAIDTKLEYNEINISQDISQNNWKAPYTSDWAIAVGEFENKEYLIQQDTIVISDSADIGDSSAVNSITIINFKGVQSFSKTKISWFTISEINLNRLELEKSNNEINWETIISYQTLNNSTNLKKYNFLENLTNTNSSYYYRLKSTFNNNEINYSDIIEGQKSINEIELLQSYPNPSNGQVNIEFSLPKDIIVNLAIYNSIGEKVKTIYTKTLKAGYHKAIISTDNLSSGVYIYALRAGYFFKQSKIILLK